MHYQKMLKQIEGRERVDKGLLHNNSQQTKPKTIKNLRDYCYGGNEGCY